MTAIQQDDLTLMKGIDPTSQKWLRDELHIRSMRDLAALTPSELEAQLLANDWRIPRELIESWIAQAQDQRAAMEEATLPVLAMTEQQTKVEMDVIQVRIFQPADQAVPYITSRPVQMIAQPIKAYEAFAFEAILEDTGPTSGSPAFYSAHFYARDLGTGQKTLLGQAQSALTNNLYRVALANIVLQPGTYRIQICVTLRGAAGIGFLEMPLLLVA